jgi:DNA-binding transcriptional MerR regulator
MYEDKHRVTKVKLEEIPRINTYGRDILAKGLTEMDYYKETNKDGIYFTEEELQAIEQKYRAEGILLKEVFVELRKKKWRINPNTIKHYIQIGQLPRSIESKRGILAHYPTDFIRHINLIRFIIESGRKELEALLSAMRKVGLDSITDLEILQQHDPSYKQYDMDFIQMFYSGINAKLLEGISNGKEAIKKAFADDNKKMEKYMKRLKKIEVLVEKLENEVNDFKNECEKGN